MGYFQYQTVDSWGWFWEVHTTASWGRPMTPLYCADSAMDRSRVSSDTVDWGRDALKGTRHHEPRHFRCLARNGTKHEKIQKQSIEIIGEDCSFWGPLMSLEVPRVPRIWWRSHGNGTDMLHNFHILSMSTWEPRWLSAFWPCSNKWIAIRVIRVIRVHFGIFGHESPGMSWHVACDHRPAKVPRKVVCKCTAEWAGHQYNLTCGIWGWWAGKRYIRHYPIHMHYVSVSLSISQYLSVSLSISHYERWLATNLFDRGMPQLIITRINDSWRRLERAKERFIIFSLIFLAWWFMML